MAPGTAVALGYIRPTDVGPEPQKQTRRPIIGAGYEDYLLALFEQFVVPHGTPTFLLMVEI